MKKLLKFPSIEQFRNVVHAVQHQARYIGKDMVGVAQFDSAQRSPTLRFEGTVKLHGCVHSDTLITLADGSKEKIKDVIGGTSILSYNETTKIIEFDIVKDVIIQELDKNWLELSFDNGTILKCTEDHPLLTTEGWVEAKYISENHVMVTENTKIY